MTTDPEILTIWLFVEKLSCSLVKGRKESLKLFPTSEALVLCLLDDFSHTEAVWPRNLDTKTTMSEGIHKIPLRTSSVP